MSTQAETKAKAEALVPKFKFEKLLNQGVCFVLLSTISTSAISTTS